MIKQILFTIAVTACSLCASAQDSLYVVQKGHTVAAYKLSDIKYLSTERPIENMQEFSAWESYPLFAGTANWVHGLYYHDVDRNVNIEYCYGLADPNMQKIRVRGVFGQTDMVFEASAQTNTVTLKPTDTGLRDQNGNAIFVADYNSYGQQLGNSSNPYYLSYADQNSGFIELNLVYYTQEGVIATGREYIVPEGRTSKPDLYTSVEYAGCNETGIMINCIYGNDVSQLRVSLVESEAFKDSILKTHIFTLDREKNNCLLTFPYDVAQLDTTKQYNFSYTANVDSSNTSSALSAPFRINNADIWLKLNENGTCKWTHTDVLTEQDNDLWCRYREEKEDSVIIKHIRIKNVFGLDNEVNIRLNTQTNEACMEPSFTGYTDSNYGPVWIADHNYYWGVVQGDSTFRKQDIIYSPQVGTIRIPLVYYVDKGYFADEYETIDLFQKETLDQSVQVRTIGFETDSTGHPLLQVYAKLGRDLAYAKLKLCQETDSGYIDMAHPLQEMEIRTSGLYTFDIQKQPNGWIVIQGYDYDGNGIFESNWCDAYDCNSENDSTARQRAKVSPTITNLPEGKGNKLTWNRSRLKPIRKSNRQLQMMKPESALKPE